MTTASDSSESTAPLIRTVLHPSDFSEGSVVAFAHALKVALISKSKLVLIHVSQSGKMDWANFPGVRKTLARWKLLPAGSAPSAVVELGIDVAKVIGRGSDPVKGVLGYIEQHDVGLPHSGQRHGIRAGPGHLDRGPTNLQQDGEGVRRVGIVFDD